MAKKFYPLFCLAWFICLSSVVFSQGIDVSPPASIDLLPPGGQTRVIPVILSNNTGTIDAYSLKLAFPTTYLTFVGTDNVGTLTDGWTASTGAENTQGVITIGGFNTTGFTGNGTVINVTFTDTGVAGAGLIELSTFADDFTGASTTDGILNSTVPVELVSFSVQVSNNEAALTWATVSETNNFGFEIQKSFDKKEFEKIGFVAGHGTTVEPNSYSFTDRNLDKKQPLRFYRLKQIDNDGSFTFSGIISAQLTKPEDFSLKQNYPNPFNPETTIAYELPKQSRISIVIYNLRGHAIRTLLNQENPAGFHSIVWNGRDDNAKEVASGVYIYKIKADGFTDVRKMTLVR